ncbi:hypothetical protein [Hymenobacter metallicola]|uniref:Uncharacterized protein n=1 Tax=Hymenobacter metallicola TaxID=2563114 RepID=A0A4Z0QIA0_9BACT|nr:hypothetical protein [Hymenobacter metallicola]TGE29730.1 hypothetical protein E5K02_09805 [Hymenobacter metallicola]
MAAALVLADGRRLPLTAEQRVGVTVQANNLLKVNSVQSDYSSTLNLADTPEVRAALEQAQHGPALTELPYQLLPCTLESNSLEVLPNAVAIVEQHETGKGFEAQVVGGNEPFYAAIEGKKLQELTFPESTEHDWLHAQAVTGAGHTSWKQGYVYDLYDRGKGGPAEGDKVHLFTDDVFPSVYVRAVWEQLFAESGYRWAGPLPELFDRLLLPTTVMAGYGEAFRKARKLRAGIGPGNAQYGNAYEGREEIIFTVPYDSVDAKYGYAAPTAKGIYNPVTRTWKALEPCYVNASALTNVILDSPYGSGRAQLFFYMGSKELAGGTLTESKKGAGHTTVSPSVNLNRFLLQAGEELHVRIKLSPGEGVLAKWGFEAFNGVVYAVNGNVLTLDHFTVEVLPDFPPGGRVRLQDLLPDLSQQDFVKAIIGLFGLTQQTDPYTRTVHFTPTGPALVAGLSRAPDWQPRIDADEPAPRLFHLPGVAQQNWFRWKKDETNLDGSSELGNGFLACNDTTLERTQDVLTLPWAATVVSESGLLLLPTYKVREGEVSVEIVYDEKRRPFFRRRGTAVVTPVYDKQTPTPRLVVQTNQTRTVTLEDGQASAVIRPRITTFAGLDFAADLLPSYYQHLRAVYARPLILKPSVRLSAQQVMDFSQLQPVWLETEGSYFYCNKIDNWEEADASTPVELLRLTF